MEEVTYVNKKQSFKSIKTKEKLFLVRKLQKVLIYQELLFGKQLIHLEMKDM